MTQLLKEVNGMPFYTFEAQKRLCVLKDSGKSPLALLYELELLEFANSNKINFQHYQNMQNSLVDKLVKSYEILAGIRCNTNWKEGITTYLRWDIEDLEVLINPLQSGVDAVCFNSKTKEVVGIELKHTKGPLRVLSLRDNRGSIKGECGVNFRRMFKWHFHATTPAQRLQNYTNEVNRYRAGEEFGICFSVSPALEMIDCNSGIVDSWLVPGPTLATYLDAEIAKGKDFPIGFNPNFLLKEEKKNSALITLEHYDLNKESGPLDIAKLIPRKPTN